MTTTTMTTNTAKEMLRKAYARRLIPDESGGYVASILEFPGCVAEGETAEEALQHLDEAAESWLEVALSHGQEVRDPIEFGGYSGKIALRIPRSLHKQVAEMAELEGSSVNQLLVMAIAHYVGGKQLVNKLSGYLSTLEVKNINIIALQGRTFPSVPSGPSVHTIEHVKTDLLPNIKITKSLFTAESSHG